MARIFHREQFEKEARGEVGPRPKNAEKEAVHGPE
jgi:hypothetical protein